MDQSLDQLTISKYSKHRMRPLNFNADPTTFKYMITNFSQIDSKPPNMNKIASHFSSLLSVILYVFWPLTLSPNDAQLRDRNWRPEGGEWEPIKISLEIDPSSYIPKTPQALKSSRRSLE